MALALLCLGAGVARAETVYLISNGWHTGIALPRAAIDPALLPESADFASAAYIEFGWGDAEFYRAEDPGVAAALRAALIPSEAVMHLAGLSRRPERYFPSATIVTLELDRAGLRGLQRYFAQSFDRGGGARAQALGPGLYRRSFFYKAKGSFHLFNTCNTWAAKALAAGGVGLDPVGVIEADDLLDRARAVKRQPAE